jgi:hypothetical protein
MRKGLAKDAKRTKVTNNLKHFGRVPGLRLLAY